MIIFDVYDEGVESKALRVFYDLLELFGVGCDACRQVDPADLWEFLQRRVKRGSALYRRDERGLRDWLRGTLQLSESQQ